MMRRLSEADLAMIQATAERTPPLPWLYYSQGQCCKGECISTDSGHGIIHDASLHSDSIEFLTTAKADILDLIKEVRVLKLGLRLAIEVQEALVMDTPEDERVRLAVVAQLKKSLNGYIGSEYLG